MSEWDGFDNRNNENEEVIVENVSAEENTVVEVVVENMPAEESAPTDAVVPYNNSQYDNNPYNPYGGQMPPSGNQGSLYNNNPYSNNPYNNQYGTPYNNQYSSTPYNNNPYGNSPYNNNPYSNNPYNNNQYNNNPYNNNQYNNNPYNNNPYNNNQYNNNPYNNNQCSNNQYNNAQYNSTQYENNPYGNNSYSGQISPNVSQIPPNDSQIPQNDSQYNNNPYDNEYGNPPYNDNPYSPYSVPPKKNKNGLIIGIVIGIVVLFLIAVFALIYRAMTLFEQDNEITRNDHDEYQFDYDDDDWGVNRYRKDKDSENNDQYDDHDYDDWYDDYDDDDSRYYELHDDIRVDLFYSVDMDYYEYDTDNENVDLWVEYPIIQGGDVPNLDKLNDAIWGEVESFIDSFEKEYEESITEDDYYDAFILGYVTYMDEDKISIVFDERVYSYYYDNYIDVYLYCINIDMENGVVLENQNLLRIDDDFSIDFRERSDNQNGESYYVSMMSDQEITDHFNSADIIVFYTPMGMEIGFNYEEGWITVTYNEYEQYLKVF